MNKKELRLSLPLIIPGVNQCLKFRDCMSYSIPVATQFAIGCGSPFSKRRTGANLSILGAFFSPVISFYGSRARETLGSVGFSFCPDLPHSRTAATHHVEVMLAAPIKQLEHHPMKHNHAQNPSVKNRNAE